MKSHPLELTIVVPAYNEEERIDRCLVTLSEFVQGYPGDCEVLVVEDGSTDRTAEKVQEFCAAQPRDKKVFSLLQYGRNRGKGYAVRQGFQKASGRFVLFTDTDLSAPIDQVPLLLKALEQGADIAIGSRRLPASEVIGLPLKRRVMGSFFASASRLLVLPGYRDTQCGFKAYRLEVARDLAERQRIDGYTFDVEHLLWAGALGYRVAQVPVRWIYTEGSQINSLVDSIRMFRDLVELRREFHRLRGLQQDPGSAGSV